VEELDRHWDCCWYGDSLVASKGWIVCMWFHQEVANHPVVVRPQGVCSLVHLAAMVWFQAAAPVLIVLQCDVQEMAAVAVEVVAQ
jgi:hypothetical protein